MQKYATKTSGPLRLLSSVTTHCWRARQVRLIPVDIARSRVWLSLIVEENKTRTAASPICHSGCSELLVEAPTSPCRYRTSDCGDLIARVVSFPRSRTRSANRRDVSDRSWSAKRKCCSRHQKRRINHRAGLPRKCEIRGSRYFWGFFLLLEAFVLLAETCCFPKNSLPLFLEKFLTL